MKKVNFNQIQNFEVPQEWIDKALNATPKPTPFLRRPYVIGSMIGIGVILVAVITLLIVNPFQTNPENPGVAVVSTEASEATQSASETQGTEAEGETTVDNPDATEIVEINETTGAAADETTAADDPEQSTESNEAHPVEDDTKYRIKDTWYLDTSADKIGDVPVMNDTSLELSKNELFTGDITIIISPNSSFYDANVIRLAAHGVYEPTGQEIYGYAYLETEESENGDKIIRFNLFDEGAYTFSAKGYTFMFNFFDSDTDKAARDMVTVDLISDEPVTITL